VLKCEKTIGTCEKVRAETLFSSKVIGRAMGGGIFSLSF
jgi:hypothetical protein